MSCELLVLALHSPYMYIIIQWSQHLSTIVWNNRHSSSTGLNMFNILYQIWELMSRLITLLKINTVTCTDTILPTNIHKTDHFYDIKNLTSHHVGMVQPDLQCSFLSTLKQRNL